MSLQLQHFYLGTDISKVQVHGGFFSQLVTGLLKRLLGGEVEAVTLGHQILFSKAVWSQYKAIHTRSLDTSLKGIATVAHELEHVRQADDHGFLVLTARYPYYLARVGYSDNRFEVESRATTWEHKLGARLSQQTGNIAYSRIGRKPATRLRRCPTHAEWRAGRRDRASPARAQVPTREKKRRRG